MAAHAYPRQNNPSFVRTFLQVLLIALLSCPVLSGLVPEGIAGPSVSGRWSPSSLWSSTAVQMALLPGDGYPYHSRILWWSELDSTTFTFAGGQWGWRPGTSSINCSAYPDTSYLKSIGVPAPISNIFCSGFAQLPDGRLLDCGGTEDGTENGLRSVNIFAPGAGTAVGTWTAVDSMSGQRWYPTVTMLNDGVLATSGNLWPHIDFFGGLKNGETTPTDSSIGRYGMAVHGVWDSSIHPASSDANWPSPRFGHSALAMPHYGNNWFFGGRDRTGNLTSAVYWIWRNPYTVGPDYNYTSRVITPSSSINPNPRFRHSAIMHRDTMVVYGGVAKPALGSEATVADVWSFHADGAGGMAWTKIRTNTSTNPGARLGHAAFYDYDRNRMLVFGGTSSTTVNPTDTTVWSLQFSATSSDSATWSQVNVVHPETHPDPRYGHLAGFEDNQFTYVIASGDTVQNVRSAIIFGGHGTSTTRYNDVWRLLLLSNGYVRWMPLTVSDGSAGHPSSRSWESGGFEGGTQRLFVFGGETASGVADDTMWVTDLHNNSSSHAWQAFLARGTHWSGETAILDYPTTNRVPDIYSFSTGHWTPQSSGTLLQQLFPQSFLLPSGKVFFAGATDTSRVINPSTGLWESTTYPTGGLYSATSVAYLPGKVLSGSTYSTASGSSSPSTTTKTIDLTATTPAWSTSGSLAFGRFNTNMTLLPTGNILITGGTGTDYQATNVNPIRRPEIWDPATGAWSGGTGTDTLNASSVPRGYHSTAILLPDARILCAGGNDFDAHDNSPMLGDVYCPSYLFNSDGTLATRPTPALPPAGHMNWTHIFTLATDRASTIKNICLMKPCATTHGFDMDQRYVPLSFSAATGPNRLFVTCPVDGNTAPQGDYLLFMLDSVSTGAPRVPSVATWIKINSNRGRDSADVTAPDAISNLSGYCTNDTLQNGHVGSTYDLVISWSAPADDDTLSASGVATAFDLRKSNSSITDANFSAATQVAAPSPGSVGAYHEVMVTGLSKGSTYYFRIKTLDDNQNLSAISNQISISVPVHTICDGGGMFAGSGGGGGFSMHRVTGSTDVKGTSRTNLATAFTENSLFSGAQPDTKATDVLRLVSPTILVDGSVQVRLRTNGARHMAVDRVRLMTVDHESEGTSYAVSDRVVLGTRMAASKIARDSTVIAAAYDGSLGYPAAAGEVLSVDLGSSLTGSAPLVIEAASGTASALPDSSGILVQTPDGRGGWTTVQHIHPRQNMDAIALDGINGSSLRLEILSPQTLNFVGRLAAATETPTVQWATLKSAQGVGSADKSSAIASADTLSDTMAGADSLTLAFAAPALADGKARDYFLAVDATPMSVRASALSRSAPSTVTLPLAFALRQNQPNPFSQVTSIRFELPVGAMVRMEVFDPQGRRVKQLASHFFPAGYHSVMWDHVSDGGQRLGPGVYFYRIEAGTFRDRKKMVLLP